MRIDQLPTLAHEWASTRDAGARDHPWARTRIRRPSSCWAGRPGVWSDGGWKRQARRVGPPGRTAARLDLHASSVGLSAQETRSHARLQARHVDIASTLSSRGGPGRPLRRRKAVWTRTANHGAREDRQRRVAYRRERITAHTRTMLARTAASRALGGAAAVVRSAPSVTTTATTVTTAISRGTAAAARSGRSAGGLCSGPAAPLRGHAASPLDAVMHRCVSLTAVCPSRPACGHRMHRAAPPTRHRVLVRRMGAPSYRTMECRCPCAAVRFAASAAWASAPADTASLPSLRPPVGPCL
jgi:hypothetical protein